MNNLTIPHAVDNFRVLYRRVELPRYYSGIIHVIFAATVLVSATLYHGLQIQEISMGVCIAIPIIFLFGNWIEYVLHRFPLHHLRPGFKEIFKIHTKQHHQYFTDKAMGFETHKDFHLVFFPYWSPILFVVATSALGHFALAPIFSPEIGHLFAAMAPLNLFLYEILHFCYHLDEKNPLTKIPFIRTLRQHHIVHHNPGLMKKYNFNLTMPIFDWIYGTTYEPQQKTRGPMPPL